MKHTEMFSTREYTTKNNSHLTKTRTTRKIQLTFKVPISRLGILHIRNFWVFLSKMIIYLLSRKFHIRGVFRRQSWLFQGFLNYGREKKNW